MRIIHICTDGGVPPDGTKGASVHLRKVAATLARRGHHVITLSNRDAIDPRRFPVPLVKVDGPDDLERVVMAAEPPDIIYERYSIGHREGMALAHRLGCPFVLEVNAPLVAEARDHRRGRVDVCDARTEVELWRGADLVVTVSDSLREIIGALRSDRRTIVTIENGVDLEDFPEVAGTTGSTVAFLGNARAWHGVDRLPGLMASLVDDGLDASLLVIGGGELDRLRAAMTRLGLEARLEVTGPMPHRAALKRLLDAAIGIAPYPPSEPFYFSPLKVVEYMAAGLPVVATDQGSLATRLGAGGVVVPAEDDDRLATAVADLLRDPAHRRRMGRAARRRAESFTWDAGMARLEDAVADLPVGGEAT